MGKIDQSVQASVSANSRQYLPLFILLLAIWFFGHPYGGIWHDARLYAAQALSHLYPEIYKKNDLFLLYGSQDDFTLFTPVYAAFIKYLGLNTAAITLLLAGFALWVTSAMLLTRSLLHGFAFWLALVLIFVMPSAYLPGKYLRYAEPFLTSRLFAEGLVLLSLTSILRGRQLPPFVALAAAFALHPLTALGGGAMVCLYALRNRWKLAVLWGVPGFALIALLALAGISPLDRIFRIMDPQWYDIAFAVSGNVFLEDFELKDWNPTILSFSLLAAAATAVRDKLRHLFILCLAVGLGGLLLTWISTTFSPNLLLLQLQPWRALWLSLLFSYIAAAWLTAEYWNQDEAGRLLLLGFLTSWLTISSIGGPLSVLTCGLSIWHTRRKRPIVIPKHIRPLLYLIPLLAADWWLASAWLESGLLNQWGSPPENSLVAVLVWVIWFFASAGQVVAIATLLAVWRYSSDQRRSVHLAIVGSVLFLFALSVAFWDIRDERTRYYEKKALQNPIPSFTRIIPPGAVVYWQDDVKMTWFVLGRANYASRAQAFGVVFSRETAIEAKKRIARLDALGVSDGILSNRPEDRFYSGQMHKPSLDGLVHVCHDPLLGFVVLSEKFDQGVVERYLDKIAGRHYYLYDCAHLRQHFTDTWINPYTSELHSRISNQTP